MDGENPKVWQPYNKDYCDILRFHIFQFYISFCLQLILTRFGTRLHFELIVITKVDTINDNVVSTGRTISKQSPCAIYSASAAW